MPRCRTVRGYIAGGIVLAMFALSFVTPILLGAVLGVFLEESLGIRAIYAAMPIISLLLVVLPSFVSYEVKAGLLGRWLDRFVTGRDIPKD